MTDIAIVLGSTRPNRVGGQVAEWVHKAAVGRDDATFELVDLRDHPLPHLDEPVPPMLGRYQEEHTRAWAETVGPFDGFVFVTPEYNRGLPSVLKNAIDFLGAEWRNKAAGVVSYGVAGGIGAAAKLREMCGQLGMADVSPQVTLMLHTDFEAFTELRPSAAQDAMLADLLDEVVAWSTALAPLH